MGVANRLAAGLATTALVLAGSPAQAQVYFQPPVLATGPVTGQEPAFALQGATPKENEANLIWSLRAALNVAALQCDRVALSVRNVSNYNAMLTDHRAELQSAFNTLNAYFVRIKKSKPAGQTALDQYFTRLYSSFSTSSVKTFCITSHSVGRDVVFAPRGGMLAVAQGRMTELRASLAPSGEQLFPGFQFRTGEFAWLPDPDNKCWKKNRWNGKCAGPPANRMAAR